MKSTKTRPRRILAGALAGEGIVWENNPREGKIDLRCRL